MFNLSKTRSSFPALLATQFFGALNDNLYKFSISFLLLKYYGSQTEDESSQLYLLSAVFTLPFLLFAPYSGYLADRFSKTMIIRSVKVAEVLIMGAGSYFILNVNVGACYLLLFLMGLHSTLFSPAKYGIIPEIIEVDQLSKGNGYLQLLTFVAIIIGSALAGVLMAHAGEWRYLPAISVLMVSILGLVSSLLIHLTPPANPARKFEPNPFSEFRSVYKKIRAERSLYLVVQGINYFWMLGAVLQPTILLYAKENLHLGETGSGVLLAICGIGIGVGSVFAGKVSEGKVELGLLPLGSLGLAASLAGLFLFGDSLILSGTLIFSFGVSAGTFIVPLNAFLQKESPQADRGSYLATASFLNSSAMLVGSLLLFALGKFVKPSPDQIMLIFALISLIVGVYITKAIPGVFIRCINWLLAHAVYSIKVIGKENVPSSGGGLIVCNHVSFIDAQLLLASLERPVRFLMHRPIYDNKFFYPIARAAGAIPISREDGRDGIASALEEARSSIKRGELVGIFAEGSISRIGQLLPFKQGFETIMQDLDAPIIPAYIDRLWGSIFSFRGGKFLWKRPKKIPYPLTVSFGQALSADTKSFKLRSAVQELSVEAFKHRDGIGKLLPFAFLEQLRSTPLRSCLRRFSARGESYLSLFAKSILLANRLKIDIAPGDVVALSLTDPRDAAISNLALCLVGAVPFNLTPGCLDPHWTKLLTRTTAKFVICDEKFDCPKGIVHRLHFDDLSREQSIFRSLALQCAAILLPGKILHRLFCYNKDAPESLAFIVATRGRTGDPKLVKLSHANISANVEALADILELDKKDLIYAPLPFWHGYGLVCGLWLPLLSGTPVLIENGEPERVFSHSKPTTVFEQSSNLELYAELEREKCRALKRILVGGKKPAPGAATKVESKLGIEVYEGFGSSELGGVALLNVSNYHQGRYDQRGEKDSSVGHPLPGMAVKIVNPKSGVAAPVGDVGVLAIKSNSVMLGYLDGSSAEGHLDGSGWYITDDRAKIEADGFVELIEGADES